MPISFPPVAPLAPPPASARPASAPLLSSAPASSSAPPVPPAPVTSSAAPASFVSSVSLPTSAYPAGGHDPDDPPQWSATVAADRAYYDSVVAAGGPDAASIKFPDYCPDRHFVLTGPQMRIGRLSPSRGFEPEIDLTGPPPTPASPGCTRS